MMVLKNEIWPVRMERITDSSAAEVMKLMMLKSEIFSPLSGLLSVLCLKCSYGRLLPSFEMFLQISREGITESSRIFSAPCSGWMQTTSRQQWFL